MRSLGVADLLARQFGLFLEAVPDAMIVVDGRGAIVLANHRAEQLLGYQAGELLGQPVELLVPERFRDQHAAERKDYNTAPRPRVIHSGLELYARASDGRSIPVEISLTPIATDEGVLVVSFLRDLSPLARSEAALVQGEETFRLMFASNPLPMWVYDRSTLAFLEVNDRAVAQYGYSREEFLAMRITDIRPPEDVPWLLKYLAEQEGALRIAGSVRHRRKSGETMEVEVVSHPLRFAGHDAALVVATDVTERRRLEEQLRQAQKMEAVGQLAGGIAHDFNNLLGAITIFGELAAADLPAGDPRRADLDSIQEAAQRATTLTRQLLAFSRKQVLRPRVLDPNTVITDLLKILGRLIGEDVELVTELDPAAGLVNADAGQLEQVLVNLAVNARDAMPTGGRLTIATSHQPSEAATADGRVVIAVTDTGVGMTPEVQARIFEPFFTTKGTRGTGLGLATVYGIVQQSGGQVAVRSEPGRGSTFTIGLPAVAEGAAAAPGAAAEVAAAGGTETILLAEDDPAVRLAVSGALSRLGYTVLVTHSAEDALIRAGAHGGHIHLVITDVIMPGMDGPELIARLRRARPGLRALLVSGYAGDDIARHRVAESGIPFLAKPFTSAAMAAKVREVLDGVAAG